MGPREEGQGVRKGTQTTQAELSSLSCQQADQRHEKETDWTPKTRASQAPSVTLEPSCGSQLIKGLASYTQTYQLAELASTPCCEPPASREILGWIKNPSPYILFSVECWQEQKKALLEFQYSLQQCLFSNRPLENSHCFTNTIHLTAGHPLPTTSLLGESVVAELLPRNKFVTMEWLVWKKYPLDQGI